jgi:hypothetical protein
VKSLRHVWILALAAGLSGCAYRFNTRTLGVPVSMAEPMAQGVVGDTFHVTTRTVHVFWGLAVAKDPGLQPALANQLGTGTAVHNLAINAHKSWGDVLVTVLTLGVVAPTSVTYSGIISHATP